MRICVLILAICWLSQTWAADNDQALTIVSEVVAGNTCIKAILPPADDNCKQIGGGRGQCSDVKDCVCGKADKHIEWQSADISQYSVYFYNDSPFTDNCKLTANSNGKLKCRIRGDADGSYDYGIKVAGCADYDPRIIIKQN